MQQNDNTVEMAGPVRATALQPGENPLPLPPPIRIARLADMYYISVSAPQLTNTSAAVKQLSLFLDDKLEDETVVLTIDPGCFEQIRWSDYMTFMGVIQDTKCKVVVRCDKMDFGSFSYFYLLGDQLEFYQTGALFFPPLYSNNKAALSDYELAGVSYMETLLRKAVERGILSEDQFNQIDQGGYSTLDYGVMLERKRAGLGDTVILQE